MVRSRLLALPFLAAAAVAAGAVVGPAAQEPVPLRATQISDTLWMLEGAGGNLGLSLGEDGVFLIDDQFAWQVPEIRKAIESLAGEAATVDFLLNTHWHGDHTGGNADLGGEAVILSHENVRRRLAGDPSLAGRKAEGTPPRALPEITWREGVTLHLNGEAIRVQGLPPGHTDGDSIVWFPESRAVHLGDQFFSGRFPFIDLGSGGDVQGYAANLRRILAELPEGTRILPGHGPLSERKDLEEALEMIEESLKIVETALHAGRSREEILATGMPERWKDWSWQFIDETRWLGIVVDSLQHGG